MNNNLVSSLAGATNQLCAPGAPFEVVSADVAGVSTRVFAKAPAHLGQLIDQARNHGDREFLVYLDRRWTFRHFFEHVDALAHQLLTRYGLRKGDRVAIAMRNRPEWLAASIAVMRAGGILVPLNSWGQREELALGLSDSTPRLCFCDEQRMAHIADDSETLGVELIVTDAPASAGKCGASRYDDVVAAGKGQLLPEIALLPDDPALILYTSGTTSRAKGVVSSHRAICQAIYSFEFAGALGATTSPDSIKAIVALGLPPTILTAVPFFHVSGLHAQFLFSLRTGRRMVIMYKWDVEEAARLIARERITTFAGSTAMVAQLLSSPAFGTADTSSLTAIGLGGSGVTRRVVDLIEHERPSAMCGIGYGLTESNGVGTATSGASFLYKPTSSGLCLPIMDIRTIDAAGEVLERGQTGEICLRGATLMSGYWRDPDGTSAVLRDGWFATGDVGYVDEEGFLFVVDRIKDIVNRGGEKISTAEVESCVSRMPVVAEAAAFAMPDAALGEVLALAVKLRDGGTATADEIRAYVAAHLAAFKVPAKVIFVPEPLPRNPSGKLLRRVLRGQYVNDGSGS